MMARFNGIAPGGESIEEIKEELIRLQYKHEKSVTAMS
jgi:hypothetical protein